MKNKNNKKITLLAGRQHERPALYKNNYKFYKEKIMVTLVGQQEDFGIAVKQLLELEYDALEAYQTAIDKLDDVNYKTKFFEFKTDHERHIKELVFLLKQHDIRPPEGPDVKQWLAKGKIILGNLISDNGILLAMASNEMDTCTAYENMLKHKDIWVGAHDILFRALQDEKRHKAWIDGKVKNND